MGTRWPRHSEQRQLRGLRGAEARARLERFGPNRLEAAERVPEWRRLLRQFANPLIYLLLAAIVISLVAWALEGGEAAPYEAIVIVAIVLANAVLGYVQEARAEQAVDALRALAAATAGVIRDGRATLVPAAELVPGDLCCSRRATRFPRTRACSRSVTCSVAEASLTGESEPVLEGSCADRRRRRRSATA